MSDTKKEFKDFFADVVKLGKELFSDKLAFADWKLQDGTTIVRTDTDQIGQGSKITVVSDSGEVPLVDGEYTVIVNDQPVTITVASGYVTQVSQGTDDATDAAAPADMAGTPTTPDSEPATEARLKALESAVKDLQKGGQGMGNGKDGESNAQNISLPALFEVQQKHDARIGALEAAIQPKQSAPAMCSKEEADTKFASIEKENAELKTIVKAMFEAIQKMSEFSNEPTDKPKTKFNKTAVKIDNFAAMTLEEKIKKLQTYK